MGTKVLITGLGNGILGDCSPCNYNAIQVIYNPSMLLWIDEIVIPRNIWNIVLSKSSNFEDRAALSILEYFDKANLITIVDTDTIFSEEVVKNLELSLDNDLRIIHSLYPEASFSDDNESHFILTYKGLDYCYPMLKAIYGDLYLAKITGSNCLFNHYDLNFCQLKFGLTNDNPINSINEIVGIEKILETMIPNMHPLPNFINEKIKSEQCIICKNGATCENDYFENLSIAMKNYFLWRDYDEFHMLRRNINNLVSYASSNSSIISPEDIYSAFEREKTRLNSLIHNRLPNVRKFANVLTTLSVPASILCNISNLPNEIKLGSLIFSGISTLASTTTNHFENKYKWVNFKVES